MDAALEAGAVHFEDSSFRGLGLLRGDFGLAYIGEFLHRRVLAGVHLREEAVELGVRDPAPGRLPNVTGRSAS